MMYPMIASEHPTIITGPRALNLSDRNVPSSTVMNPATFGGTVNNCAMTLLYPSSDMMVWMIAELVILHYHVVELEKT